MEKKVTLRDSIFRNDFYRALEKEWIIAVTLVSDAVYFHVDNELHHTTFHAVERFIFVDVTDKIPRRI